MSDTPERIWANPEGHWHDFDDSEIRRDPSIQYIRADLATTAPREDGYSAGVRAAAEVANAVYHTCVEDAAELTAIKIRGRILALLDAPALPDARSGAVEPVALAERERIAKELEAYGDCLPCIEDALVTRSNAMLIRANFSIEDAESLLLKTCAQALPTPACTATDGPASACVYRAPGLGTAATFEKG